MPRIKKSDFELFKLDGIEFVVHRWGKNEYNVIRNPPTYDSSGAMEIKRFSSKKEIIEFGFVKCNDEKNH
jgi:hypothetical protein